MELYNEAVAACDTINRIKVYKMHDSLVILWNQRILV